MSFKIICITTIVVGYSMKMASTTSDEEKDNFESTTRKFQSDLHIGDPPSVKRAIYKAYMDTYECGYMFSAQIYMRLIEGLLVNRGQLTKISPQTDLSFVKEAGKMIATLYNVDVMRNNFTKNVMWIVLLFAERLQVYMKGGQTKRQTMVTIHQSVSLLLKHYMASDDCVDYSKSNNLNDQVAGNLDDLQSLILTLESKKKAIMQRLNANAKELNISTTGHKHFSLNTLSLNGLLADNLKQESFSKILESSGVEVLWYIALRPLQNKYDLGTQANDITLSQQIQSLKTFNDKFILMVKIIIIRLMLKYLMFVNDNLYKTETVHDDFVELETYLGIQDDGDVNFVKSLIGNKSLSTIDKTHDEIKNYVQKFALQLCDVNIWRAHLFSKPNSRESLKSLCETLQEEAKLFVKSLKDALANINFDVIKKFKHLVNTREYKKLVEIENSLLKK